MAKNVKKIPFPKWLANIDYDLELNASGLTENGEPISVVKKTGKCILSEKAETIIDSEGKKINLLGTIIVEGDVAPSLKEISDGTIIVNEKKYTIYSENRPRNPDGTIYCTQFKIQ